MTDRNPKTIEEARAFVARVESLFMPWNVEALVAGFTRDCVVRFGSVELQGQQALRDFFVARRAKQRNYRLSKRLCALMGDTLANVWDGEWEDRWWIKPTPARRQPPSLLVESELAAAAG